MCTKEEIGKILDRGSKRYYILMVILSCLDLIAGIISLFVTHISVQIISLVTSVSALTFLILGYILKLNDKKSKTTLFVSSLDVVIGFTSLLFMINSLRIISGIASSATGFKIIKTVIQTEKVKKLFDILKPKIISFLIGVAPRVVINFIDKIKKQKGEVVMKKIVNFFKSIGTALKNNVVTTSGSILVTASASLSATWLVKHLIATGLLPLWASYVVGIVICIFIYGFIEFALVKYGAEDKTHVFIRKSLKRVLKAVGADEMVEKISAIENEAIEEAAKKKEEADRIKSEEEARIKAEAEARIAKEKAEEEALLKEAKERLEKEEAEKKAAADAAAKEAEAEAKRIEEEKAKEEHEKKVLAMMEKLRK